MIMKSPKHSIRARKQLVDNDINVGEFCTIQSALWRLADRQPADRKGTQVHIFTERAKAMKHSIFLTTPGKISKYYRVVQQTPRWAVLMKKVRVYRSYMHWIPSHLEGMFEIEGN